MSTAPDRIHYRELVAEVAAKAKARLPAAVNGRVESAVKLVLQGDVLFCDDGTVEVGSASDPLKTYTLAGHACDCQDSPMARPQTGGVSTGSRPASPSGCRSCCPRKMESAFPIPPRYRCSCHKMLQLPCPRHLPA